jgi:hypothetical protein
MSQVMQTAVVSIKKERSFVDQIQIRRGNVRVLGRYFLQTETRLADMGLTLRMIDSNTLLDIFDANRSSWESMGPQFNSREGAFSCGEVAPFAAYTSTGEAVGVCGVRYFDLGSNSLSEAVASLEFIYGDNAPLYRATCQCLTTPDAGDHLSGRLIFSGAQWIHPKFRGTGLAQIIVLVPRAYALSQWEFEHEVLFAKAKLARPHVVETYGLAHAQDGVSAGAIIPQ